MRSRLAFFLKLAGVLAALAALAAGAATLALRRYLPPEKLSALARDAARRSLDREVRFKAIRVSLLRGLEVEGLEVSERPDFKAGRLAAVESFALRPAYRALLRKKLAVASVSARGLSLRLTRDARGRFNFQPPAAEAAPAPAAAAPAAALALAVGRAELSGEVVYRDEASGQEWKLGGIEARLRDLAPGRPFSLELKLRAQGRAGRKPVDAALAFDGTVDPERPAAKIKKLRLEQGPLSVALSGSAAGTAPCELDVAAEVRDAGKTLLSFEAKGQVSSAPAAELAVKARSDGFDPAALKVIDAAALGVPKGLLVPRLALETRFALAGRDLRVASLRLEGKAGALSASGSVKGALGPGPEPALETEFKLAFPALRSADLPWAGLPPGLELPAARLEGSAFVGAERVRLHPLRLALGSSELSVEGSVGGLKGEPAFELALKSSRLDLGELAAAHPATRELGLAGKALLAVSARGTASRPVFLGKLSFKEAGAEVAGLRLSGFSGTLGVDERRADLPDLKGRVNDGELSADVTVRDYARAPAVELEGSLSRFDLGAFLAALQKAKAQAAAAKPPAAGQGAAEGPKRAPWAAKGRFSLGKLVHPNAEGESLELRWDLTGIAPGMRRLGGAAKFQAAGGRLHALGQMATQSGVVKVLIFPLVIVQKVVGLLGLKLFPDFNDIEFSELAGDYVFREGVMTVRDSHLYSEAANVTTQGTIDLPSETLDLVMSAQVARLAPLEFSVKGTLDKPVARPKLGKFLADPAKQLLENIFQLK